LLYVGSVGLLKLGLYGAEGVESACLSTLLCLSLPKSIGVFLCKFLMRVCTESGRMKTGLVHFDQILRHVYVGQSSGTILRLYQKILFKGSVDAHDMKYN